MLVLTRGVGEKIIIGDGDDKIVIQLIDIKEGRAKLGIEAPKAVSVHREEIYDRIKLEGSWGK